MKRNKILNSLFYEDKIAILDKSSKYYFSIKANIDFIINNKDILCYNKISCYNTKCLVLNKYKMWIIYKPIKLILKHIIKNNIDYYLFNNDIIYGFYKNYEFIYDMRLYKLYL